MTLIEEVARAICKSRTCEGIDCCEYPGSMARKSDCPVDRKGYDDAAQSAIRAVLLAMRECEFDYEWRDDINHFAKHHHIDLTEKAP